MPGPTLTLAALLTSAFLGAGYRVPLAAVMFLGAGYQAPRPLVLTGGSEITMQDISGDWVVTAIGDDELDEGAGARISFEADKMHGNTGCNPMFSGLAVEGRQIRFGNVAMGRMFCDEAAGKREYAFTEALRQVTRYEISDKGVLVLYAHDNPVIAARR